MGKRNFKELLEAQWAKDNFVCVGLDSDYSLIPKEVRNRSLDIESAMERFNFEIIDATKDLVCAYKPNIAFYERCGSEGLVSLRTTIAHIREVAPRVSVILDAKRADIDNTNAGYAEMAFDYLKADAITVHPYLGRESLEPFLSRKDKGIFVLCRTSNPGAGELQDLQVEISEEELSDFVDSGVGGWSRPRGERIYTHLYVHVAYQVRKYWNKGDNCGLVVEATNPYALANVRKAIGDIPILIPGIGAQGGDLEKTVAAGKDSRGCGMIVNSSRGIIFASKDADFAEAARRETIKLRNEINHYRRRTS